MNYYRNFTTGVIDGLLTRMATEGYSLKEDDPKFNSMPSETKLYSRYLKQKVVRDNVLENNAMNSGGIGDKSRVTGVKYKSQTKYLFEYLNKADLKALDNNEHNWDWSTEFSSPFDNATDIMLCFFKLITGMQSITRKAAVIDRDLLVRLELDVASVVAWKKEFERLFYNEIVSSYYEEGKWSIKLGGGCLRIGEGPGYINLKIQKENLINNIEEYHKELLKDYSIL
jgi:hypothetical protein